jgi:hypothetical protein
MMNVIILIQFTFSLVYLMMLSVTETTVSNDWMTANKER